MLEWNEKEWETSPHISLYQDLAATAQLECEKFFKKYVLMLKSVLESILTGGLNCAANTKIFDWTSFEQVYALFPEMVQFL